MPSLPRSAAASCLAAALALAPEAGRAADCEEGALAARLQCLGQKLARADAELNALYQQLRKALPAPLSEELKEDSRRWIAHKEGLCRVSAEIANPGDEEAAAVEARACLLGQTEARVTFLRRAFPVKPAPRADPTGDYDDGRGGSLTLQKSAGGQAFHVEVVRGPTFHLGEIDGEVALAEGKAVVAEVPSDLEGEPPCRLTFTLRGRTVELVEGEGCLGFHGARAYFDGKYRLLEK